MSESAILPPKQPLTNRRKFVRAVIAIVAVIVLVVLVYAVERVVDLDLPKVVATAGDIAAIQFTPTGSRIVIIKPDHSVVVSPSYRDGSADREPVWSLDGNRLYFVSDRDAGQINLYRWNPGSNHVERRTETTGTYTNLIFSDPATPNIGLVASGGKIVEFDPASGTTAPILPPTAKAVNSQEGAVSSMEAMYGDLGTSFKEAIHFGNGYLLAILRGDRGDTIIVQDMRPNANGQFNPPIPVATGDRIDMDYCPRTGNIVYAVQGFRFADPQHVPPEYVKNGQVVMPFRHVVAMLDPHDPSQPVLVMASKNDANVFANPVFSPDGSGIVVAVGRYKGLGDMEMTGLLGVRAQPGGGSAPAPVHRGTASDVTFTSDGKKIAYVARDLKGNGVIHVMNNDGSDDEAITDAGANFGSPRFSPQ